MSDDLIARFGLDNTPAQESLKQTLETSKKMERSLDDTAKAGDRLNMSLADAEKESRRLEKTINQQEKLTSEWRQELVRVEAAQKNVGRGSKEYFRLQKAQKDLNRAINENVEDIKGLRIDKRIVDGNVRDLKKQERQLEKNRKETARASKETSGFEKTLKRIGPAILAAFTFEAARRLFTDVNRLAAQFQQFDRKAAIVFGDALDGVTEAAERNAIAIGLTRTEYISAAAGIQDILVPLGFARGQASELATETTNLAGAISAWSGGQYDAATSAQILQKALTGEVEQLKSVGIVIDQSSKQFNERIKLLMQTEGLTQQQAKALDILNQISEKSVDAQANLGEATEDVAVQQAKANAEFRESREILVRDLTPAVVGLTNFFTGLAKSTRGLVNNFQTILDRGFEYQSIVAGIAAEQNILNNAIEEGNREQEKISTKRIEELKQRKELADFEHLSLDAKDDAIAKETLTNDFINKRIKQLESQVLLYKTNQTNLSEIEKIEQRIAFLKGEQVEDEKDINDEKSQGVKLTQEQIEAERELAAAKIALKIAEQERNNAIINDNLQAEIDALEAANSAAKEAGNKNIRQREENNARIIELNRELLQSDLRLAEVREDAKREEISLLQSIENKTPQIQAQIFAAQTELVALSRSVDDIFLKLATGGGESFTRQLAPDIDFSEGVGSMPTEQIEEAVIGMNNRLQMSYEDLAKRTVEIYKEQREAGITQQQAYEQAVKESEGRIYQARAASAAATLSTIGNVFGQIASIMGDSAENSKELALFEILTNTAAGIASAVSAGAGVPFPANLAAIGAGIAAVLSGIAQARGVLNSSNEPQFNQPSFAGGGSTDRKPRIGGVDGKGGFNAILHPKEVVIDTTDPYKGFEALSAHRELDGWVNRYYGAEKLTHSKNITYHSTTTSTMDDRRLYRQLKKSNEIQSKMLSAMNDSEPKKFKRAG